MRKYLVGGAAVAGLLLVVPQSDEVWHYGQLGRRARAATVTRHAERSGWLYAFKTHFAMIF